MRSALFAVVLWCCLLALPGQAKNLASARSGALPPLPGAAQGAVLAVVDGRVVALGGGSGGGSAWVLGDNQQAWAAVPWPADASVLGVAGNGKQAYLLLGQAPGQAGTLTQPSQPGQPALVHRVARLILVNGVPALLPLPALPQALAGVQASATADRVYLAGLDAGGQARLLHNSPGSGSPAWTTLPGWPGKTGTNTNTSTAPTSVLAQTNAVFVTTRAGAGQPDRLWRWSTDGGWLEKTNAPGQVLAGSARALGQASGLYLVREAAGSADRAPALMTMHTITGAWTTLALRNAIPPGVADPSVAPWRDGLVWAETASLGQPGATAVAVASIQVEAPRQLLHWLDWAVIVVYLTSMLGIGLYFYLRERRNSTAEFFVGGRSIPFWAAGISLYAANTSSISYIAIPAKAFETNWQYMTNNLIAVLGLMFVAVWIVPLLRRLDLMSVFSYLETRFHPAIRVLASGLFILTQLGSRMSVILYLPSLAIATITGIDVVWSILLMGGFTIVYTAIGGMKAVVWTDVAQLIVKMGGALFAIGFMIFALQGGWREFLDIAAAENKTKLLDFSFDLSKATVWGFLFLVLFDVVLTFPKDQVLMQRTLSTDSAKNAGRSIWAFAAVMIPGGVVFYTIGTALFAYYKTHPERMNPLLSIDATFPLFIAAELPVGLTGLIIAGIFAAAMATLSSILNSVATLASVDFYEKLVPHPDPKTAVRVAEGMTVLAGLAGVGAALVLTRFDIHSLFDVSIELAGLLGGGFAGAYTLGMFTRRANSGGVAVGVASSIVLTTLAWSMKLVHPYFYLAISIMLCIVIGYGASFLFPPTTRSLKGLTIYADKP